MRFQRRSPTTGLDLVEMRETERDTPSARSCVIPRRDTRLDLAIARATALPWSPREAERERTGGRFSER